MELRQYTTIIWRWLWLIVLATVLAGGAAYIVSANMTPVYQASAKLLINQANTSGVIDFGALQTSERLARTYAERICNRPVLEQVVVELNLGEVTLDELAEQITIQPVRDTQLVEVIVEDADPALAAAIANTLPEVFILRNETQHLERYAASKASLRQQMAVLERDIASINDSIAALSDSGDPKDQSDLTRLQNTLSQYQSSYSSLLSRYEEFRLAEAQTVDNIIVDEPAVAPEEPVRPRKLTNTLLASVVGTMLAVGVIFLVEYLDDTVRTPEDISDVASLSTLTAIIGLDDESPTGLPIALRSPRSPAVEAYRALRTNVQFSSVDRPVRTLVVTSSAPGEGKSVTASNLAVVMAQSGLSTILVDADLRRPTVHRRFGLPNAGLTTALTDTGPGTTLMMDGSNPDIVTYLQNIGVENLRILSSGSLPPNPAEVLGSDWMKRVVKALEAEADIVIFDTPPLLSVTDAVVLSSLVDGVLLVVEAGRTRRGMLQHAVEELQRGGTPVLGAVLNRLTARGSGYYHYYHSYYSSNGGDGSGERRRNLAERIPFIGSFLT